MRRSKPKETIIWEAVPITSAGANGKSLAKVDGLVVFVTGAVPGDVADLPVLKKKKSYAEATAIRITAPSPDRVSAFCPHFGTCGGCKWQDLSYPKQLEYKQQQVIDNLERIGGLVLPVVRPILPSVGSTHYRNKLEFTFSNSRWFTKEEIGAHDAITDRNALGFHIPMRFDRVLDIINAICSLSRAMPSAPSFASTHAIKASRSMTSAARRIPPDAPDTHHHHGRTHGAARAGP